MLAEDDPGRIEFGMRGPGWRLIISIMAIPLVLLAGIAVLVLTVT